MHPNDAGIVKISDKWYPALITLLSAQTATLAPSRTPTHTPATYANGDVNHDNNININAALLVARAAAGLSPAHYDGSRADVNCDGQVGIVDALLLAQHAAGMSVTSCQ